jgi:hypothetical protein
MFWIAKRNLNLRDEYSRVQQNLLENDHEYVAWDRPVIAGRDCRGGGAFSECDQREP